MCKIPELKEDVQCQKWCEFNGYYVASVRIWIKRNNSSYEHMKSVWRETLIGLSQDSGGGTGRRTCCSLRNA